MKCIAVQGWTGQQNAVLKYIKQGKNFHIGLRFLCLGLILFNTACSTLNSTPNNSAPTHKRSAFMRAVTDPNTWIPTAAALVIAATDSDQQISDWATEHYPIYGSYEGAQDASNQLRGLLATSALVTSVVAPGQQDALVSGRTGNLVMGVSAAVTTSQLTNTLKDSTERTRPNNVDQRSLPSSHSSAASTYATISAYRVDELSISAGKRKVAKTGFHTLAAATAWARVEAQAHYPTDVLAGYALGNFSAVLMHEIFQSPKNPTMVGIDWDRNHNAYQLFLRVPF